jgi:hypothetical protein
MNESGKLDTALHHIAMFGNLDGMVAGRAERVALIMMAHKHGLVVWSRWRRRYRLSRAGHKRAAATGGQDYRPDYMRAPKPPWMRPATVAAGLGVVAAGCIAVGAARLTSNDDVRKPQVAEVHDTTSVRSVAAPAQESEPAPTAAREPEVVSQPPPPPAPKDAGASAAESNPRATDSIEPASEPKARHVTRTHRRSREADARDRRYNSGWGFASTDDPRFPRPGSSAYRDTSKRGRNVARPNGWGWW